jgi:hypothetical protein
MRESSLRLIVRKRYGIISFLLAGAIFYAIPVMPLHMRFPDAKGADVPAWDVAFQNVVLETPSASDGDEHKVPIYKRSFEEFKWLVHLLQVSFRISLPQAPLPKQQLSVLRC